MSVIVTGASGNLGRLVAENLMARVAPKEVVLVTRRPAALKEFAALGVDVRYGDFDDAASLPKAFAGGRRMLLISTDAIGRRTVQHRTAIDAAAAVGVGHVVYTSHVSPVPGNPLGEIASENAQTETALREAGFTWTVLRFGSFAELQVQPATMAVSAGKLVSNAGDGRIAPVSRYDCAEAAAIVLTTDGHQSQTYEITGPASFSQRELASLLGEVTGRTVRVVRVGDNMLSWGMVRCGVPRPVARAVTAFGRAVREGYFDVVDPAFERLSGRPPRSLREVLIRHRGDLLEAA